MILSICSSLIMFFALLVEYHIILICRMSKIFAAWIYFLSLFLSPKKYVLSKSDKLDAEKVVEPITSLMFSFASIFLFCEFGERITYQFSLFNDRLCQCNWYAFSMEVQRIYLIALSDIQHPVLIRGFANTLCTRIAFKHVN